MRPFPPISLSPRGDASDGATVHAVIALVTERAGRADLDLWRHA
jgi:hypothetical protein